jgi:hypothetical protein
VRSILVGLVLVLSTVVAIGLLAQPINAPRLRTRPAALSVRWLAPKDARTVSGVLRGSACEVVVRDGIPITRVGFTLDGRVVSVDTHPPYSCHVNGAQLRSGTHVLNARAFDAAGRKSAVFAYITIPRAGRPLITVTLQGDSLTYGSWWWMPADLGPRFAVVSESARIGRGSERGLALLREQRLGRVVVFALGTNDWRSTAARYRRHLETALRLVGPRRCLVTATIWREGRPNEALNRVLHSLASRYGAMRMQVAPWAQTVAAGRVPSRDGTHPQTRLGWKDRARIVAAAVRACAREVH